MISRILIGASAGIILFLGSVHLAYTFLTHKFSPTEKQLETAMKQVAPRISGETTMWKVWIGIHVSHSMGLVLFGLIYGYLALCRWDVLLRSHFLIGLGLVWLVGYILLAHLLVQDSFDRGLFSHAALPRGSCWHICTRMREAKRRRFSETALSSCLSLLLADVTRPGASIKQRLSVLQRRTKTQSGRRRRACALASVRRPNCTCGFPACSFHEDT